MKEDPEEPNPFASIPENTAGSTSEEARRHYLERARSGYATIRRALATSGAKAAARPGPMRELVRAKSGLMLDFYLLRLALARVHEIETLSIERWCAILTSARRPVTARAVLRAIDRLHELHLVERDSAGRAGTTVDLLQEDGSKQPWRPPEGKGDGRYFTLPFDYWVPGFTSIQPSSTGPLFTMLTTPGKAVLLIMLAETNGRASTDITWERATEIYGVSESTLTRGWRELERVGLGMLHNQVKNSPEGYQGKVYIHHRALCHPFSQHHRDQLRQQADLALRQRPVGEGDRGEQPAGH